MRPLSGNFGDLALEAVRNTPDKVALIGQNLEITYSQLHSRMNQAGNLFLRFGVQKGDRVALLFQNDVRYIEIFFGLQKIGAVPVPLNAKLGADALAYIIEDSGAKILVSHRSWSTKAEQLHRTGRLEHVFIVGQPDEAGRFHPYEELARKEADALETVPVKGDDISFLPYTSGSTGKPKGCMLTHSGQWWNAETNRTVLQIDREDRSLVAVPLYHKNAMVNAVKPGLLAGTSIVILPDFNPADVIEAIHRYRCTYLTGVPSMYKLLLNHYKLLENKREYDLTSLKFFAVASSDVPPELVRDLQETFNVEVLESYGLTEGGPNVLATPRGRHRQGSAGLPLPGGEVKVVSTDGSEQLVTDGSVGELWVRNPGVAKGYWNRPDTTKQKLTEDGWLKTGDLARMDRDGYVYIIGRKDDMIITGGENVYPKEIEDILLKHEQIEDVCVVAVPHEVKGQVPVAFVKTSPGSQVTEQQIQQYFFQHGPAYAYPRKVIFIDRMPLSGTGKIDRSELSRMALEVAQKTGSLASGRGN